MIAFAPCLPELESYDTPIGEYFDIITLFAVPGLEGSMIGPGGPNHTAAPICIAQKWFLHAENRMVLVYSAPSADTFCTTLTCRVPAGQRPCIILRRQAATLAQGKIFCQGIRLGPRSSQSVPTSIPTYPTSTSTGRASPRTRLQLAIAVVCRLTFEVSLPW